MLIPSSLSVMPGLVVAVGGGGGVVVLLPVRKEQQRGEGKDGAAYSLVPVSLVLARDHSMYSVSLALDMGVDRVSFSPVIMFSARPLCVRRTSLHGNTKTRSRRPRSIQPHNMCNIRWLGLF